MKRLMQLLKLIGIGIFLWIIWNIDREQLMGFLKEADWTMLAVSPFLILIAFLCKSIRWHILVRTTGVKQTFKQSWQLYNIGAFLSAITPAKLGEIGRAAYLRKAGMHSATALSIVILDRLIDVVIIAALAIVGIAILFSATWSLVVAALFFLGCLLIAGIWRKTHRLRKEQTWLQFLKLLTNNRTLLSLVLITFLCWTIYFVWAVIIARSLGITVPVHILVSCFTITGILALIPIAPSGLGTRDAALLTLLAPYGVSSSQAVALAILMFVTTILLSSIGSWYWMRDELHLRSS